MYIADLASLLMNRIREPRLSYMLLYLLLLIRYPFENQKRKLRFFGVESVENHVNKSLKRIE